MYKNFNLTESERERILNMHKEHGYKAPLNEQESNTMIGKISNTLKTVTPYGTAEKVFDVAKKGYDYARDKFNAHTGSSNGGKIMGNPMTYLQNANTNYNPSLGMKQEELKYPFRYSVDKNSPSTFGVGSSEIKKYIDFLNVYGKVPGTGIPIPYEGDDLRQMQYWLWGNDVASNQGVYGAVEDRTTEGMDGKIYPAVEAIRALYTKMSGRSLWNALQKKLTDSDEDLKQKQQIIATLVAAYQKWIDSANGKDVKA